MSGPIAVLTFGAGTKAPALPSADVGVIVQCAVVARAVVTEPFMVTTGPRARDRRVIERDDSVAGYVVLDDEGVTQASALLAQLRAAKDLPSAVQLGIALGGLLQRQAQEIVYGIPRARGQKDLKRARRPPGQNTRTLATSSQEVKQLFRR